MQTVAAVDLGSNSFHLIVARASNGEVHVLDRLQETVRLAGGFNGRGCLDKPSRTRALECLHRFSERLRDLPSEAVRAVGTDALRRARNGSKFLAVAGRALGHPIEIISGQEEARLIYGGVAHDLPDDDDRRLIVDIGGGSTEFIIGRRFDALLAESLHMGCVSFSQRHFAHGRVTARGWRAALTSAQLELQPIEESFRARGWRAAYGSSGTLRAVSAVLRAHHWTEGEITPSALAALRERLLGIGDLGRFGLDGLSPDRAPVFAGGVAILAATFDTLGLERMEVANGALREGLLYDLLGRLRYGGARDRTIAALTERYHVDTAQAERVQQTAAHCLAQVAPAWELDPSHALALDCAARLHEVGLAIAHTKYHRHGAYLVAHSDLPGFSLQEQRLIATLVRGHRRRFPVEAFDELPKRERRTARRLCVLLRLAVLLHRGRTATPLSPVKLSAERRVIVVRFPRGWLGRNPLTCADLMQEAAYLRAAKFELRFG